MPKNGKYLELPVVHSVDWGFPATIIVKMNVSRVQLIQWLKHETNSRAELFITGSPSSILKRVTQRANDELSSEYPWTYFGIVIHGGWKDQSSEFPGGELMSFDDIVKPMRSVHAF